MAWSGARWRLAVAVVVVAAVVASGRWLEGLGPAAAPRVAVHHPVTGVWLCPHGGGRHWKGWVAVANPGRSAVRIRVTPFGASGRTAPVELTVPQGSERLVRVPADWPGAGSEVEYFGGWVAATSVVVSSGRSPDAAAARCVVPSRQPWWVPDVSTPTGTTARLVVMNPFATTAAYDVTLRTETRSIRPGPFTPGVLAPYTSATILVNTYALLGPGEHTVSAEVTARVGRVAVGSILVSARGLRAEPAIDVPAARWVLPAAGYAGAGELAVVNPRRTKAAFLVESQGAQQQTGVGAAQTIGGQSVRTVEVGGLLDAGTLVTVAQRAQLAMSLRVAGAGGGLGEVDGTSHPGRRWVVPTVVPPPGGSQSLVLQNPGSTEARVTVSLLGSGGPLPAPAPVVVPAGRTVVVHLEQTSGGAPVAAVVLASRPIAAGMSGVSLGGRGFSLTMGFLLPGGVRLAS